MEKIVYLTMEFSEGRLHGGFCGRRRDVGRQNTLYRFSVKNRCENEINVSYQYFYGIF